MLAAMGVSGIRAKNEWHGLLGLEALNCGFARGDLRDTVRLVYDLWDVANGQPRRLRVSVFEFRTYPGTPEWHRLMATGLLPNKEPETGRVGYPAKQSEISQRYLRLQRHIHAALPRST